MSILVTGGAGYIGSITVRRLRDRGDDVVVLDRVAPGYAAEVLAGIPFIQGDIRDDRLVRRLARDYEVDAAIHLAADKSVEDSMSDPGRTFDNNVGGTIRLVDALASAGVGRLVFSSTCAVYGAPKTLPVTEAADMQPESPYGESKWMSEKILDWFERCHGVRSVSLRYFNAAGAWPDGTMGEDWATAPNLIPAVLKAAWTDAAVQIFGNDYPTPDGTALRDYVHVLDLADAHLLALDHLARGGPSERLNLGTGEAASVTQVIDIARRVTGRQIRTIARPRRPGDAAAVWADATAAGKVLGWLPLLNLHDMVESAWRWHVSHPGDISGGADGVGLGARAT